MNVFRKFSASILLSGLLLLGSCGVDPLEKKSNKKAELLARSECGCTHQVRPVCYSVESISFENVCQAKCYGLEESQTTLGRCEHDDYFQVCLDGSKSMTEKAAFIEIKNGRGTKITKYSACDIAGF